MIEINNDIQFRKALDGLSLPKQRTVGALFIKLVDSLSNDNRIDLAVKTATNVDAGSSELTVAFKEAKAAAMDSYTRCGADADWSEQAAYFVARAASAIVSPGKGKENVALTAAMNCRMARTCTMIEKDIEEDSQENAKQYSVLKHYLNS